MIEIRKYKTEDALELLSCANERGVCDSEQYRLQAEQNDTEYSSTVEIDGFICACFGIRKFWDGVGDAWAILPSDEAIKLYPDFVRSQFRRAFDCAKEHFWEMIKTCPYVRVQTSPAVNFIGGNNFAKWVGFKYEGTLKKFYPIGIDCNMYAIIKE